MALVDDMAELAVTVVRLRDERDAARADADRLAEFAEWLCTLDDPEDALGREQRRTVTLTQIIDKARAVLADRQTGEREEG